MFDGLRRSVGGCTQRRCQAQGGSGAPFELRDARHDLVRQEQLDHVGADVERALRAHDAVSSSRGRGAGRARAAHLRLIPRRRQPLEVPQHPRARQRALRPRAPQGWRAGSRFRDGAAHPSQLPRLAHGPQLDEIACARRERPRHPAPRPHPHRCKSPSREVEFWGEMGVSGGWVGGEGAGGRAGGRAGLAPALALCGGRWRACPLAPSACELDRPVAIAAAAMPAALTAATEVRSRCVHRARGAHTLWRGRGQGARMLRPPPADLAPISVANPLAPPSPRRPRPGAQACTHRSHTPHLPPASAADASRCRGAPRHQPLAP